MVALWWLGGVGRFRLGFLLETFPTAVTPSEVRSCQALWTCALEVDLAIMQGSFSFLLGELQLAITVAPRGYIKETPSEVRSCQALWTCALEVDLAIMQGSTVVVLFGGPLVARGGRSVSAGVSIGNLPDCSHPL